MDVQREFKTSPFFIVLLPLTRFQKQLHAAIVQMRILCHQMQRRPTNHTHRFLNMCHMSRSIFALQLRLQLIAARIVYTPLGIQGSAEINVTASGDE